MVHFEKWKIILILVLCALGFAYASPNLMSEGTRESLQAELPGWAPTRSVNLGLDLQGGAFLLAEIEIDQVKDEFLRDLQRSIRAALRGANITYVDLERGVEEVTARLRDPSRDRAQAERVLAELDEDVDVTVTAEGAITVTPSAQQQAELTTGLVGQAAEVIRRRIDESGLTEPVIQPEGRNRVRIEVPGYRDNIQDLERLVTEAAVMTFHMVPVPGETPEGGTLDLPHTDPQFGTITVNRVPAIKGDRLADAGLGFHYETGEPVVNFRFDSAGGSAFGRLTAQNRGRQFAIVLDGEIISAPVINSPILGGAGFIEGRFTVDEATELGILMRAGALPAPMRIVQRATVGPSLGADSIAAGKIASVVAIIAVVVFMLVVYRLFGVFASVALIANVVLIFAILSFLQATLTLPGIAGIVLTMGMAVDANVLIFERIKEEARQGRSAISAIDAGYGRALTTIVDSNITTLIAAGLLAAVGTGPIRGFAITLSIGILTSMFTAIMVTRLQVVLWLKRTKPKALAY